MADAILIQASSTEVYIPYLTSVVLSSIAPCRIILNLRDATMNVDGWDLASTMVHHKVPAQNGLNEGTSDHRAQEVADGVQHGEDGDVGVVVTNAVV